MMKKIIALLGITTCIIGIIIYACNTLGIYDDKDTCLDIGVCKAGLTLNIDGQKIIVNQQSCSEHNGLWREKYNDCWFKD